MGRQPFDTPLPDTPRWLTIWFPLGVLAGIFVFRFADPQSVYFKRMINSEEGIVENATVALLLAAMLFLLLALGMRTRLPDGRLGAWLLVCLLGTLYFAGEEASWGQHWFGWNSPDFLREVNAQRDINLHNIEKWSGTRVPKSLLVLGIVALGLVWPLWRQRKRITLDPKSDWRYWVLPTEAGMVYAGLLIAVRLVERIEVWLHLDHFFFEMDFKEILEFYIAGFLLAYSWSFWRRLSALDQNLRLARIADP